MEEEEEDINNVEVEVEEEIITRMKAIIPDIREEEIDIQEMWIIGMAITYQ